MDTHVSVSLDGKDSNVTWVSLLLHRQLCRISKWGHLIRRVVLAPATQLGQLVGDLEPEFAPLDLPSANAEACWALAATQRRLSPANAVLFDALAALLKERQSSREN